jgi:hypothetical protein
MQRMTIGLIALMFATAALPARADDRTSPCCGVPVLAAPAFQTAETGNKADAYHAKHPARIAGVSSLPSAPRPIGYSSGARGLQRAERRLWRDGAGIPGCAANGC